jgi:hypothetical protein
MMTGINANMVGRGGRLGIRVASGVLALMVVAAGGFAVWYRLTYNVWPGQQAFARVHWCGRNYEPIGGRRGPGRRSPRTSITRSAQWARIRRSRGHARSCSPRAPATRSDPPSDRRRHARWWSISAPAPMSTRPTALRAGRDTDTHQDATPTHRMSASAICGTGGCLRPTRNERHGLQLFSYLIAAGTVWFARVDRFGQRSTDMT